MPIRWTPSQGASIICFEARTRSRIGSIRCLIRLIGASKGLGETVITKLLAIENRFIPIYPYRGEKGKAPMLALLGLHSDELDELDRGTRLE